MKKFKLLFAVIFLFANLASAGELWINNGSSARDYLSIKETDSGLRLRLYHQDKGDYQTLVRAYDFKSHADLSKFINHNFPQYIKTESLSIWPIKSQVETAVTKKLDETPTQIWAAKSQWTEDWEAKYSQWIQNDVSPDFFKRYNIQTDCADAVVGLRWIYARINYLPVANTLADSGNIFGHFSMKKDWRKLSTAANWYDDKLFLTALNYVMDLTSTQTVINDGFPVKISKEGLVAGRFIISRGPNSGHARMISESHYNDATELPLITLASTIPRAPRLLTREVFLDQEWPIKAGKEILAFRWPVLVKSTWVLQNKDARPIYSLEQFDTSLQEQYPTFFQFVLSRVKDSYDPLKLVEMGLENIVIYAEQRVQIVVQGYEYCRKNDCRPGSQGEDDWGTPSRDDKLIKKFHDIDALVNEFEKTNPGLDESWKAGLRSTTIKVEGRELKLSGLRFIMENNLFSSNPVETPAARWGLNAIDRLTKITSPLEKLLKDRSDIISRAENPCSENCFPKTDLWVGLSTYHIDAQLNDMYVQVSTYCSLIAAADCESFFKTLAQKNLIFNSEAKSLQAWFETIPFFHSDPRVSLNRRWGMIPANIKARKLPYFESIKISKNSLALLDNKKLIDLNSGVLIFENTDAARMVLTEEGLVFKINDNAGQLSRLIISNDSIKWVIIADPDQILLREKERRIYIDEDRGYTIFRKPLTTGLITFRVSGDKIEFIKEHTGATHHMGSLVTMAVDKNTMSFIDLDRTLNININFPASNSFIDMNLVEVSSYNYPQVVLSYGEKNEYYYYAVVVDLEKKTWTRVAQDFTEPYIVLWSNASLKKAIVQTKFNEEFPVLYALNWNESVPNAKVQKLANILVGAVQVSGESLYFLEATGGIWDNNPPTKVLMWNKNFTELSGPSKMTAKFLTSLGVYYSSDEKGMLRTFNELKDIKFPRDLLPAQDFYQMQNSANEYFSYRFSTNYGDFAYMGGSLQTSAITKSIDVIVPNFSNYAWINKEYLLDLRWQKTFSNFDIQSGQVISLGKNIGIWWK